MPNYYIDNYHKYIASVIMFLCYWSYFMACWVDPGKVSRQKREHEKALNRFKFDGVIFEKKQTCRTCKFEKPPRSKHCSMCGICVQKYDHHCVWINGCVGLYNYRYFLAFLFLHAIICTYGFCAGVAIFMAIIRD